MYDKLAQTYHVSMLTYMHSQHATHAKLNLSADLPKALWCLW